jgi:dTDP-4-dehydrorhamnose 3,5-epimerase
MAPDRCSASEDRPGAASLQQDTGGIKLIFREAPLAGAWIIEPERSEDERGFFARTWDGQEFAQRGLNPNLAQCSISYNHRKGTLRGLHYQAEPYAEAKLVRCTAGAIYDVIVDLRSSATTFKQYYAVELSAGNRLALYVPEGFAHGFLTLEDGSEIFYQISTPFVAGAGRGVRWNDPAFEIHWPGKVAVISERDRIYPDFHG